MERDGLFEKYLRKVAARFAAFVLFSIWIVHAAYVGYEAAFENLRLVSKSEARIERIRNVLENRETYLEKSKTDETLKIVVEKTLEWATVYENGARILWNVDRETFAKGNETVHTQNSLYVAREFEAKWKKYLVILESENARSLPNVLAEIARFLAFSLPFFVPLYLTGRRFAKKNLEPIEETVRSLEDFSANANHEIKNPLAEIVSTLALAKRTKSNYEEAVDQWLRSAEKIDRVLDSMGNLVRLADAPYRKERLDLEKEIRRVTEEFAAPAKKKGVEIVFSGDSWKRSVATTNRAHLEIVVGNLLKNAVKYTPQWGKITVSFRNWSLSVKDTGIGIAPENLKKIFERYFRENYVKEEWYGLWLWLVKKISDANGWKVEIRSAQNEWTEATVRFS